MKSTAFVLLTTASVSTCLQTGDFFPLPHDDDDITSDVSSGQLTASPKEDIDTCSLDCNGGKCLDVSLADGAEERICDCTHAYTETTHYAGEFCQYPSTTFCTGVDDPNGRQFCVNGGQCPSERHLPCMCPTGFSGPRCAFQLGVDGLSYRECELDCQNGGTCRKGMNEAFGGDLNHFLSAEEEQRHINYEHCVCPLGFYGMRCEYKATECGSGQHKCFHGSVCVKNDDDKEFGCDCSSTQLKTAGLYCEHVASTDCGEEDSNEYGYRGFCTNGGQCDVDSDGSTLCACPKDFSGYHCEFRMSPDDVDPHTPTSLHNSGGVFGILGIVVSAIAAVTGIAGVLRYHRRIGIELQHGKTLGHSLEQDGEMSVSEPVSSMPIGVSPVELI